MHEAATDAPGSFADTIAGIDHAMALHPAHVETGLNVTIVRANVDHLMPLTALAVAKGFSKINFQFTTPFGRAWEAVVPPLEEAANAVMRVIDRYASEIDIHVINAQFCVFPGYERYVTGDLQKLGRTMVFAADPRFPEQVNLYQWLGARREKRASTAATTSAATNAGSAVMTGQTGSAKSGGRWPCVPANSQCTFAASARPKAPSATAPAACSAVARGELRSRYCSYKMCAAATTALASHAASRHTRT